jgi:hypothetical protein
MNRFKSISVVLFAAVLAVAVISCKDEEKNDLKAEGKKAGTEMCDCVASYTAPNPADFADQESFQAAFMAYAANLGTCPGVLAKYQEYVTFVYENYNPEAENPLYSVFTFTNADFEAGFKEGTSSCMETFAALFALMGGQ